MELLLENSPSPLAIKVVWVRPISLKTEAPDQSGQFTKEIRADYSPTQAEKVVKQLFNSFPAYLRIDNCVWSGIVHTTSCILCIDAIIA